MSGHDGGVGSSRVLAVFIVVAGLSLGSRPAAAAVDFLRVSRACEVSTCVRPDSGVDGVTYDRVTKFCGLARGRLDDKWFDDSTMPEVPSLEDLDFAVRYGDGCQGRRHDESVPVSSSGRRVAPGGLSQSTMIWGMVDFLVGRAREQLSEFAVERFTGRLCADAPKDRIAVRSLFPGTCKVLTDDLLTEFMTGFTALQAAVRVDLQGLPLALAAEIDRTVAAGKVPVAARVVFTFATRLVRGEPPLAILRALHEETYLRDASCKDHVAGHLFLATLALASSIAEDGNRFAIPTKGMRVHAALAFAVNIKLLAERDVPIARCFAKRAREVEVAVEALAPVLEDLSELIEAAQDLTGEEESTEVRGRKLAKVVVAGIDLVVTADEALAGRLSEEVRADLETARAIAEHVASGRYGAAVLAIRDLAVELGAEDKLPAGFVRLMSFAADYATARDVETATAAIEAFVLPKESYRGKRRAERTYVRVNAYLGIGASYEIVDGKGAIAMGGYAPIGLEVGTPVGDSGYSIGLLLHVVDLGALTTWRIKLDDEDQADARPEVGFDQIISPGAMLAIGIKDAPFTIGVGVSRVPDLRLDENDTLSPCTSGCDAWRVGVNALVDIPLF